ncbi:lipase member H-A-like [Planococcus citri]|uniref:lipase member H-A-like n=1 Tax=Planococcus citri TaxID=170843 RepID=UPI0031F84602
MKVLKMQIRRVIFSTLVLLLIKHTHGYQYGPVIDRVILYAEQYTSFIGTHINSTLIRLALLTGVPYLNVPQYPLRDQDIPFYLYTRKNPDVPEVLYVGDSERRLLLSGFDSSLDTVLYAHGYGSTFDNSAFIFTSSLLPRKNINLIIIKWDSYSFFDLNYTGAITVFRLGTVIARFLQTLFKVGADRKKIHLIGFSDGAEAVALAGKQIYPRVARITVFDPAGGSFNFLPPTQRVSITDADYVQIIHCTVANRGLPPEVIGDVTFYMNGALIQPQCSKYTDISTIGDCSHGACGTYLNESLQENSTLLGIRCAGFLSNSPKDYDFSDKVILTYDVPTHVKGLFCVDTRSNSKSSN